jgi:CHAT domain-containing protein
MHGEWITNMISDTNPGLIASRWETSIKQSAFPRPEYRKLILGILMIFLVAPIAPAKADPHAFFTTNSRVLEPQATAQEPKQAEVGELKLAEPIERELKGGEGHSYRITLTAGQYLHVIVEQKGIDVVVRLFGPDGQKITEVDGPNGTQGPEKISVVTEVAGRYRLEMQSLDKGATTGKYELKIEDLREATSKDRDFVSAERLYWKASELRSQGTPESRRQAIKVYEETLPLWRALGEKAWQAETLNEIGVVYASLTELPKALEYYGQALVLIRALGDRQAEASTLNNIGLSHWRLGQLQEALEYSSQALPLVRAVGNNPLEVNVLNAVGLMSSDLGRPQDAHRYYNQALVLAKAVGDRAGEARALNNLASAYLQAGDLQKALDHNSQALALRRAVGDRRGEATTLYNTANTYNQLGESQKALDYLNQALLLNRAMGDRMGEGYSLEGMGVSHEQLGELQKALDFHNQALTLRRTVGNRRGEAYSLYNIGKIYERLGKSPEALDFDNQAFSIMQTVKDLHGQAVALYRMGVVYSRLENPKKALEYHSQALQLSRETGDQLDEAVNLYGMARAQSKLGNNKQGRTQIEAALAILESTRSKVVSRQLRSSFLASKQNFYELYIDVLMQMHREQSTAGYDAAALQASERARARGLLETLSEASADIRQGVEPVLLERERSSQQQLNAKAERLTRLLTGKHTEEQETSARKDVEALLTDYQELEAQIRAKSPRYAALTQPQPLSLKEIQQLLDEDTLLLEYALGDERSYLWAVTPTTLTSFELPKRTEIEQAARRVYEALTARNKTVRFERQDDKRARIAQADADYLKASAQLSQMVLQPVAAQLGRKRLLIMNEGALQYVPFGTLPAPLAQETGRGSGKNQPMQFQPLIANHEIVSLPSASVLAILRKESAGRQRGTKTVAVLADPVFQDNDPRIKRDPVRTSKGDESSNRSDETSVSENPLQRSARDTGASEFQRLPHTRQEANEIVAFASRTMRRESLDFQANRAVATSGDLSDYRIVHFATHGFLNSQHPELSGIVLSLVDEAGKPQDGFLRLHEIYNLKLGADLVVLSACRTALGKEIKGEGLVGLTRGFMYAGAPRVVASLWAVDDEITAELMKRFYREMLIKRQRPAAALRAAQVSIWKDKGLPPYYWAAFVLQGEWK